MKRFLSACVVFVCCFALSALAAYAGKQAIDRFRTAERELSELRSEVAQIADAPCHPHCHRLPIEERVIDLPEDGNTWHTILILRDGWEGIAAERRAEAMFATEPLLASLKHQTHWHLIKCSDAEFKKFAGLVDATPCLILERANGQVVYRESGPELGKHPHALTRAIRKEIQRHCPDGHCLPLHPTPDGHENEPANEVPSVLHDDQAAEPPKKSSPLPLIAVALVAGGAGFAIKFRKASGA